MFDVGFSELVVIGVIALLVLGPKRLPEAARTAGKWVGRARRFMAEVKQDFDVEMNKEELAELRQLKQELEATRYVMEDAPSKLSQAITAQPALLVPTIHSPESTSSAHLPDIALLRPARPKRAKANPAKKSRAKKKHDAPEPSRDA